MAGVLEMQGFRVCQSLVNRHLLPTSRETIYNDEVDWLSCQREPQDSRLAAQLLVDFGWVTLLASFAWIILNLKSFAMWM